MRRSRYQHRIIHGLGAATFPEDQPGSDAGPLPWALLTAGSVPRPVLSGLRHSNRFSTDDEAQTNATGLIVEDEDELLICDIGDSYSHRPLY